MRSIVPILISFCCLCIPGVPALILGETGATCLAGNQASTGKPETGAATEGPLGASSSIATAFAGHFSCRAFDGLERDLCIAASDEDRDEVARLIKAGADIDARSRRSHTKGMTLLQVAVWHGWSVQAVGLLIDAGAKVNTTDPRGNTALIYATQSLITSSSFAELLIKAGADVNAKGHKGMRPLMHASLHDETGQAVQTLIEARADVSARDSAGWTALMHATRRRHESARIVELLIEAGSNVNARHNHGGTALSNACYNGHVKTVELLIKAGAKVNTRDETSWTPLLCASIKGHVNVARLLVQAGADVNAKDKLGRTPLSVASSNGDRETARLLMQAGAQ